MGDVNKTRRKMIFRTLQGVTLAAVGGTFWAGFVHENAQAELVLRPPGARPEPDFLATCIRCGLCVEACPYDTLRLGAYGEPVPVGTPYFKPREVPCYLCEDIPCAAACPTDALDLVGLTDEDGELDVSKSRMGVAVVDYNNCIANRGLRCDACVRACPYIDDAIYIDTRRNPRTGKHAMLVPVVDAGYCTGCGLCEYACVTEEPAILVLPRDVALGKAGEHYELPPPKFTPEEPSDEI